MAVKVSWTSWAMGLYCRLFRTWHPRKISREYSKTTENTDMCLWVSGNQAQSPRDGGQITSTSKTDVAGATVFSYGLLREHLPAEEMQQHWPSQFPEMQLLLPAVYWLSPGCWVLPSTWPKGEKPSQLELGTVPLLYVWAQRALVSC